jgi:Ca-activated chloride channel family protein
MPPESRRRNRIIVIVLVLIALLAALLLLLLRCKRPVPTAPRLEETPSAPAAVSPTPSPPSAAPATTAEPAEVLTPATLQAPAQVSAGAVFSATWTGPDNLRDYLTLVRKDAPDDALGVYRDTRNGATLELTAPVETGEWELRYVTGRSRRVLGRTPVLITPTEATLSAPDEVVMGGSVSVTWTGPNNPGDFITLVSRETADGKYGNYTNASEGSPLNVRAPVEAGDGELRYMTGQGSKVIGRRAIRIRAPEVDLRAPATVIAGATLTVTWSGPNHPSDYITLVPRETPETTYGNYATTATGSPLSLLVPIMAGDAELRYMTGQGNKVIGRRPIKVLAVEATLSAAAEAKAGSMIEITWSGPNYPSDYITVVPRETPDGEYRGYTNATAGSPLQVKAPDIPGGAEIRYMTGQGGKVIGRRAIRIIP